MVYDGALSASIFLRFLKRLVRDAQQKIFLVVDNLRPHRARIVTAWVAANSDKIELIYLPPYAPEHNPDEFVNNDVKQAMTLASKIGDTRWLIAQQVGQGTPKAFVALLVFWLALLFASFGLFAPHNLTSAVILTLSALAVAGAVAMFLELEQGFGRMIHISPKPMHQALEGLEVNSANEAQTQ